MLQLFLDTDCDITPEIAQKYGARLISMPYCIDGETYYPYESYERFNSHEFYEKLRAGLLPTTSSVNEERYIQYFEPVFAAGNDIFYVHFSEKMSATFSPMRKAVDKLRERYPERRFYELDTRGITILGYLLSTEIAQQYADGKSLEEIFAWSQEAIRHSAIYFFADDLKFFRRSGRVSGLAAMVGTLIGVRPIIYMDEEGNMISIGKERGRTAALERLVRSVEELGEDLRQHQLVIGHTDAPEMAQELERMLRERLGADLDIVSYPVNPTLGSHCGPSGVGVAFHAKHR